VTVPIIDNNKANKKFQNFAYSDKGINIVNQNPVPELKCYIIEDCTILNNGIILTKDNNLLMVNIRGRWVEMAERIRSEVEDITDLAKFLYSPIGFLNQFEIKQASSPGIYYSWTRYGSNYYHWMLEYLPTIRAVDKLHDIGIKPTLFLHDNSPSFVEESINLINDLKIDGIKTVRKSGIRLPVAIIPEIRPFLGHDSCVTKQEINFLRSLRNCHTDSHEVDSCRIYSSRQDSDERRVANLEYLDTLLSSYGFSQFNPGEHSVKTQIMKFSKVDTVVGPHGANLANIIFSNNIHVIEIRGERTTGSYYKHLCAVLGHEHSILRAESKGKNYMVCPEKLEEILSELESNNILN